ncbi:MAG: threonine synthase [Actinomycetaceae bacterium]|nr:threonine synthase [Actinomycetaceae bacterium]MDY5854896.1 threonine synthase [Arcanobacterium sp.]
MRYISTRSAQSVYEAGLSSSDAAGERFCDILLEGLAADGGLYVPQTYPQLTDSILTDLRRTFREHGYAALAAEVVALFADDIPLADIKELTARAYTAEKFGSEVVTPVSQLGQSGLWLGHTSNGPTAAFKDMAMQLLGELFEYELARRSATLNILGATSGDTGSAAEYALRGRDSLAVFMLTPAGRMTAFQRAQMFSLMDANIVNVAVDGVFDDCQELVKAVNADAAFKERYHIGAVNSINWARLMAQIIYYIAFWIQLTTSNAERVSFAVPSGNFGNICAGHIARSMGLPIDKLILATNENDVLDQFFRTGVYRVRSSAEVAKTSSPSMDIAKASNFERFIFDLLDRDGTRVAELFGSQLSETGEFSLADTPEFARISSNYGFLSGSSTHADRIWHIRDLCERYGVLIDPHTADGVHVASRYASSVDTPIVVLETALPVKFASTIAEAIGQIPHVPPRFAQVESGGTRVLDLPNSVQAVKELISSRAI